MVERAAMEPPLFVVRNSLKKADLTAEMGQRRRYIPGNRPALLTLYDFKYQKEFRAEDGEPGRSQKQFGKDGKDLFIRIPVAS